MDPNSQTGERLSRLEENFEKLFQILEQQQQQQKSVNFQGQDESIFLDPDLIQTPARSLGRTSRRPDNSLGGRLSINYQKVFPVFTEKLTSYTYVSIYVYFWKAFKYEQDFDTVCDVWRANIDSQVWLRLRGHYLHADESWEQFTSTQIRDKMLVALAPTTQEGYVQLFKELVKFHGVDSHFPDYVKFSEIPTDFASFKSILNMVREVYIHLDQYGRAVVPPMSSPKGTRTSTVFSLNKLLESLLPQVHMGALQHLFPEDFRLVKHDFIQTLELYGTKAEIMQQLFKGTTAALAYFEGSNRDQRQQRASSREREPEREQERSVKFDRPGYDRSGNNQGKFSTARDRTNRINNVDEVQVEETSNQAKDEDLDISDDDGHAILNAVRVSQNFIKARDTVPPVEKKVCFEALMHKTVGRCSRENCQFDHSKEALLKHMATQSEHFAEFRQMLKQDA